MKHLTTIILAVCVCALPAAAAEELADVPVTHVTLFSSGVGYYAHSGKVTGDATVRLMFKADQINDVLKSMSVSAESGTVAGVSYPSSEPLLEALKGFAVDLSSNPELGDLLKQLRGAAVTIKAPGLIRGKILGVEKQFRRATPESGFPYYHETILNIVADGQIRSIPMSTVADLTLEDRRLAGELDRALSLLIGAHDTQRKPVSIRFLGKGERIVRIGYLVAAPIWKTSYRLDLSGKQPRLQGWAIIENTSDTDWTKVDLTLIAGKPISFVQDLYRPQYQPRATVQPRKLMTRQGQNVYEPQAEEYETEARGGEELIDRRTSARTLVGRLYGPRVDEIEGVEDSGRSSGGGIFEEETVKAVAVGEEVAELFRFTIKDPVDVGRRAAAMLPIVTGPITGERLSVYDHHVLPDHPLNGVYLTNDTGVKLLGGPVNILDGQTFAGEAILPTTAPKDRALISYGVDLKVTVERKTELKRKLTAVGIAEGTLRMRYVDDLFRTHAVTSKADQPRTLIVAVSRDPRRRLIEPKRAEEQTDSEYRFRLAAAPNGGTKLIVQTQRDYVAWTDLAEMGYETLAAYCEEKEFPKPLRDALAQALAKLDEINALQEELERLAAERSRIEGGQGRLRDNIKSLGANQPLVKRYVEKLNAQEDQIEKLAGRIDELQKRIIDLKVARTKSIGELKVGDELKIDEEVGVF